MPVRGKATGTARILFLLACVSTFAVAALPQNAQQSALDLNGHAMDPFHAAAGKILVFVFVRTDCPISNRYAPTIHELAARYEARVAFFLVYPIASETPQQIRRHLQDYGYHLPALRDPGLVLARESQVRITPEAAVFSPERKLLYHGRIDDWYVEFGRSRNVPTTHELAVTLDSAISGKSINVSTEPAIGCFIPGLT
jgi:thiol-disulfide isomerase/thioredoxin